MYRPSLWYRPRVSHQRSSEQPVALSDDFSRLTTLLTTARPIAVGLVPDVRVKSDSATTFGDLPGRYTHQPVRDIHASALSGTLPDLDRVLAVVHDVAVLAFQSWVDRLAGRSAETFSENKSVAEFVTARSQQFGLGIYFERDGVVRRVTLYAREYSEGSKLSENLRRAGKVVVQAVADDSDPEGTAAFRNGYQLSQLSLFPRLIVARTATDARAVLRNRTHPSEPLRGAQQSDDQAHD